jgi:putative hydrolase of the HAD superfamily
LIKAIIFDLDDTLYDEMQFVRGGFKAVASCISKQNNLDQKVVYHTLLDVLEKHGRGQTFDITLEKLSLCNMHSIPKLVEIYRTHEPHLSPYLEVKNVLATLKIQGYKLGLITDGDANVQRRKIESLQIKNYFDCMIFSDKYGVEKRKPDFFPYQKAMKELKISAREAIYVGDNPHKDFVNAKKMEISAVRILRGAYKNATVSEEYDASYKIENLADIFTILSRNFLTR